MSFLQKYIKYSNKLSQKGAANFGNRWVCPMCTFNNPSNVHGCEMCDAPKPGNVGNPAAGGGGAEAAPVAEEVWFCNACTSVNYSPSNVCNVCETPRNLAQGEDEVRAPIVPVMERLQERADDSSGGRRGEKYIFTQDLMIDINSLIIEKMLVTIIFKIIFLFQKIAVIL
jgi:hypothetical protein